jgi:polar amino acid transport system substrate-binding protein
MKMKKYIVNILYLVILITTVLSLSFDVNAATKKKLRLGTDASHPPFAFRDDKGELTGFDIELTNALLKRLGYEYEYQDMNFAGLIPSAQTNKIDVIVCGLTVTPERAEQVLFTQAYQDDGTVIVVKSGNNTIKSLNDLKNSIVGVEMGSVQQIIALENEKNIKEIINYDTNTLLFNALLTGKIDAILADERIISYFNRVDKNGKKLKQVTDLIQPRGMAYGVNLKNKKLQKEINDTLDQMRKDGEFKKIYDKWYSK